MMATLTLIACAGTHIAVRSKPVAQPRARKPFIDGVLHISFPCGVH